jgi:glycosyltransferase involved in cell wall biosynthesis
MPESANIRISAVVPLKDEAESLETLHAELAGVLNGLNEPWEAVYVDDGSTDGSPAILRKLHESDPARVRVITLRRNFGKSAALAAGLADARGEIVATLDADGQDAPSNLPRMIEKLRGGFDLVCGWRRSRKDGFAKKWGSRKFNFAARILTGSKLHDINCGLKVFRREVVGELALTGDLHRIIPLVAAWRGFRVAEIEIVHRPRVKGRSKYGALKVPVGFLDLTMFALLSRYSRRPGHFLGVAGLVVILAGLGIDGFFIVRKFLGGTISPNYPLFALGVLLIVVGLQMVLTGFLAELMNYNLSSKPEYSIKEKLPRE